MIRLSPMRTVFFALLLMSMTVSAFDIPGEGRSDRNFFVEPEPWVEATEIKIPDAPNSADLVELPIEKVGIPFSFWMDMTSLSVGEEDAVVRYVIVLRSSSGAQNVFFEGLRCDTYESRRYAFATNSRFQRLRRSFWKPIVNSGTQRYQYELLQYFLCDSRVPLSLQSMLRRIRSEEYGGLDESEISF